MAFILSIPQYVVSQGINKVDISSLTVIELSEMAKSMEDEVGAQGAKIIWAAANPDETSIYVMMDVPNPEFMQTFGLREDVKKAREEAGADVSSTTVITPIGDYWLG